jgi:hypothetical protein
MPLAAPTDLDQLFTLGTAYNFPKGQVGNVVELPTARLDFPSGQVYACDPFIGLYDAAVPFTVAVAPGTYSVTASVIEIADPGQPNPAGPHLRVAAARLEITDHAVHSWELAITHDQNVRELDGDSFFGYGVDAGTGCFVDAEAAAPLGAYIGEHDALMDAMFDGNEQKLLVTVSDPATGHTVVAFPSGWGDGAYPTWIGRDQEGQVVCFATEFFVVPDKRFPEKR